MKKNSLKIDFSTKNTNARVVVFGSTGFIGSSVINILKKNKNKYISFNSKNLDLTNKRTLKKSKYIAKMSDIVLFAAAQAPVKDEKMLLNNILMLENFIKIKNIFNVKKIIYVSSDAVYSDSKKPLNEFSPTKPENLHGIMHLTREIFLKNLFNEKLTIVRPTLIYGAKDPHNGYGPNKFIRDAKKNKELKIFGKGEEIRDHISIKDVSSIIYTLLFYETSGVINAVSGFPTSFLKIANKIKKMNNNIIKINYIKRNGPMPHNGYRTFDTSNLKNHFPKLKLKNFLKDYF
tara:strand:- start:35300 stop:36169 length:870 start_codon:yes stop_codon:yes gene_type:complete